MKTPAKPGLRAATESRVTVQNRLPLQHPQRSALEAAITRSLSGLEGPWDVILETPGNATLVISVIAPDGALWSTSCGYRLRDPESLAEIVRAACGRRRSPESARGRRGKSRGAQRAGSEST
jgi:hypothetical protein